MPGLELILPDAKPTMASGLMPEPSSVDTLDLPDRRPKLDQAFWDAAQVEPSHAAKVLANAQKLNEPETYIDNNLPAAEKAANSPSSEYWAQMEKQYPGTTQYLLNPRNMAVAQDDTGNLALHERIVNGIKTAWEHGKSAYTSGQLQEERDLLQASRVFGTSNDAASMTGYLLNRLTKRGAGQTSQERIDLLNQQIADLEKNRPEVTGIVSGLERGAYGATEFLPWIKGSFEKGAEYALVLGGGAALAGLETGPGAAVTGTLGAGAGLTIGAGEYNFLRMTGAARHQFEQIRDVNGEPLPENVINLSSAAAGAATAGLGLIKLGALIKSIPGGDQFLQRFESSIGNQVLKPVAYRTALLGFAKRWATSTAEATGAMTGITAINIGAGEAAKAASGQEFAPFSPKQAVGELASSAGEAALTFGVMGVPGHTMGLSGELYSIRRAEQAKRVYEAMGKTAEASKVRERLPEAHRQFVEQITKDSPVENIYIPAAQFTRYFQEKNLDPNQVAAELGIGEQLAQAKETGQDVQIPMANWVNKVVGTEHYTGLADDVKFHPEDLTNRQVQERKTLISNMVTSEAEKAIQEDPQLATGREAVFQDIHQQLIDAGRPEAEAKAAAELWAARATVEARRRGTTPEDWYTSGNLRVVTGEETPAPREIPELAAAQEPVKPVAPEQPLPEPITPNNPDNLFTESGQTHREAIGVMPEEPAKPAIETKPPVSETKPSEPGTDPAKPEPKAVKGETPATGEPGKSKIADVGQELWYNRRNITGKGLKWEDIRDMNATLKVKEVQKHKVWTRPDYEQLVTDGMHPFTARLLKRVYDALAPKPDVATATDAQMEKYISEVQRVKEIAFQWAKDVEATKSDKPLNGFPFVEPSGTQGRGTLIHSAQSLDEKVGKLIDRIYPLPAGTERYYRFGPGTPALESARLLGGNKFIHALQMDYKAENDVRKALQEGWPKPQEAWQRRFEIKTMQPGTTVMRDGKRVTINEPEFFIVNKGKRTIAGDGFKTQEEAIAAAQGLAENKRTIQRETPLDITNIKREGPPIRPAGLDVQPKDLMQQFGFRGVNYGNWTKQGERQGFTNQAYDALNDLADIVHIPQKGIGLDGLLGLAFGAQGHGGFAAAHFIPGVNEINLTKTAGAGALAHEWAHALDHYFAVQAGEKIAKSAEPFLTHQIGREKTLEGIRPEIAKAFETIVNTMSKRKETPEEVTARLKDSELNAVKKVGRWLEYFRKNLERDTDEKGRAQALKEFDALADRMKRGDTGDGYEKLGRDPYGAVSQVSGELRRLFKDAAGRVPNPDEIRALDQNAHHLQYIKSAEGETKGHEAQNVATTYAKSAKKLDEEKGGRAYWSSPTEMFARAFQSYVLDKLDEQTRRNDFLTRPQAKGEDVYPQTAERGKINDAFDTLIKNIKTKETDRGVALFQEGIPEQKPLPVYSEELKTGEPYAVFNFNWKLSKDHPFVPYYTLYGDPAKITEKTKLPNNPGGNGWRSDVTLDTVKATGIEIRGKSPRSRGEPIYEEGTGVSEGALPTSQAQSSTGQVPLGQRGTLSLSEEAVRTVFPGPSDPSLKSITVEPEYVNMAQKATEIVHRFATERGVEPTPELAQQIFTELHDALNDVRFAKPDDRIAVAKRILEKYPTLEQDFVTMKDQLYSDKVEPYFEKFVKGNKYYEQETPPAGETGKLFQAAPHDPADPRGFIEFTPKETVVHLLKADASTFIHESAHFWLKDLHSYVKAGEATQAHLADWKVLADWLKVKEDQTELTRDQQEQFAKGFEAYLREGNTPSEALRRPFALFRRWLSKLYRDPRVLGAGPSDEVKGVMDRLLASEDEIAFARDRAGMTISPEVFINLAPDVRAKIQELSDRAREQAVSTLLARQMGEVSKEHQEMLNREREQATKLAVTQVADLPEQQAMDALRRGTFKDTKDPVKLAQRYVDSLKPDAENPLSPKDQESFQVIAELHGYASADEMAKKILAAKSAKDEVKARVDQHMAQFASLKDTDAVREEAIQAIHNQHQGELLALERINLQELVRDAQSGAVEKAQHQAEAKVEAAAARARAVEIIAGKPVKEAGQFMPYFTAERNAALDVIRALGTKDYAKAAEFKRQQMLNHALVSESFKARKEIAKAVDSFARFVKRGQDMKDIPYGFIRQIDALLTKSGLSDARPESAETLLKVAQVMAEKGTDPADIANQTGWMIGPDGKWQQETLSDALNRINDNYYTMTLPDSVLQGVTKPYKDMSLTEFRDMNLTVKSLYAVGRKFERFLSDFIKADVKTAAAEASKSIAEIVGTPYADQRSIGHRASAFAEKLDAMISNPGDRFLDMVNMLTLCRFLDGDKETGPMQTYVYETLLRNENRKSEMTRDAVERVNAIIEKHFDQKEFKALKDQRMAFPFLKPEKPYLTREEMVSMALNWGNEGNRDRIRNGFKLSDDQVMEVINTLTKKEMDYVQAVWDHLDSYWPQISALEMKAAGIEPKKVDKTPVQTIYGNYEGGYYPLAYDFEKSAEAYRNADARNALYKEAPTVSAHTEKGHTKMRVKSLDRPVRLSLDVFSQHLENVIHDLSFREGIIDVNRFLNQRDLRETIQNAIGQKGIRTLEDQLKAVASDQTDFLDTVQKGIRWMRFGSSLFRMSYKLFNFPMDYSSNVWNAIWEVGPTRVRRAVTDFAMNPKEVIAFVNENSQRMLERSTNRDRDLKDLSKRWFGETSPYREYAYITMSLADQAMSYPVWNEVYNHSVGKYGPEKARLIADETIARTMGTGSVLDQAAIQRGSEYKKMLTWWYSWMGMMFNRSWLQGKMAGLEYDKGNLGNASLIIGKTMVFGWFLQSASENFWREFMRNSPNGVDDDKRFKRVLNRTIQQPFGYIPGVRDVASFAIDLSLGQQSDIKPSFFSSTETLLKPLANLVHSATTGKDLPPRFAEDLAASASIVTGTPMQFNTWVFNFLDFLKNDGELTWRDMLMRRTKS